jgi:hypothetical protein
MVSVIENWARLNGRIANVGPSDIPGHLLVEVAVDEVSNYDDSPNLLGELAGSVAEIQFPWKDTERARPQPGDRIRCRARRGTPTRIYIHPDDYELTRPDSL